MDYRRVYRSPLGAITLISDGVSLTGAVFGGAGRANCAGFPVFSLAERWLDAYFSGAAPELDLPLQLNVTPFTRRVLAAAAKITYGSTATYGEIARAVALETDGKPCARAVGRALGKNPAALFIPCHRVVGANGLGGYAWGTEIKARLLAHERERV